VDAYSANPISGLSTGGEDSLKAIRLLIAGGLAGITVVVAGFLSAGSAESGRYHANPILDRAVALQLGEAEPRHKEAALRLSGGVVETVLERLRATGATPAGVSAAGGPSVAGGGSTRGGAHEIARSSRGCPNVFRGRGMTNTRVNQDCTLRRQAEEWVGVNPKDFDNVLAGQNDSVIGFNHCGYDWSFDRGRNWGSVGTAPPPFWQQFLADGRTSDACSDPAGTFDHLGNAYVTGVFFNVNYPANGIFVAKSNWPNGGAFYHIPAQIPFQEYRTVPMGVVVNDEGANFHDKELIIADSRPDSTKKGRVYVTWTVFTPDNHSPIFFSQSTDGGATWSEPIEISGANTTFCTFPTRGPCNDNQGSDPVVGPDGTIYVIFGNANTPELGINQVMMVKCPPTNECNNSAHWTPPVRIGDLIGTHPANDPPMFDPSGCPAFRQCLPPNGYRVPEFTSMTITVDRHNNLYATWADHINNTNPDCEMPTPSYAASPPCDHDVHYSFSTDGGASWEPAETITPRSELGENAQWQPWSDVSGDGKRLYVAFYDRQYGNCETTGCNDITLATIRNPRSANPRISYKRITTASMPNLVVANNPVQAGFLGDYMWVEVSRHHFGQDDVHIVWGDTRPLPNRLSHQRFPEEDIYYVRIDGDGDDDDDDDD
jgi:hypothetical protein